MRELAERDDVSINQFIATAVAEKMSALLTLEYLEERAKRGNRAAFLGILARVPDVPAAAGDEWPEQPTGGAKERRRPSARRRSRKPKGSGARGRR